MSQNSDFHFQSAAALLDGGAEFALMRQSCILQQLATSSLHQTCDLFQNSKIASLGNSLAFEDRQPGQSPDWKPPDNFSHSGLPHSTPTPLRRIESIIILLSSTNSDCHPRPRPKTIGKIVEHCSACVLQNPVLTQSRSFPQQVNITSLRNCLVRNQP